jgi:hypothetical protein
LRLILPFPFPVSVKQGKYHHCGGYQSDVQEFQPRSKLVYVPL